MKNLFDHRFVKENKLNPTMEEVKFLQAFKQTKTYRRLSPEERQKCFQYPIPHDKGFYILDFYIDYLLLGFEIDGGYHLNTIDYDLKRKSFLKTLGIKIISFTNDKINSLNRKELINEINKISRLRYFYISKHVQENKQKKRVCKNIPPNVVYHSEFNGYINKEGIKIIIA